jgi:hypothetical protein
VLEFEGSNYVMIPVNGNRWESNEIKPKKVGSLQFIIRLNDTLGNQKDVNGIIQIVDTVAPPPPSLIRVPEGELEGWIEFELSGDFDEAGIASFHLIISTCNDPSSTSNRVFETSIPYNGTGALSYLLEKTLSLGTYYYFLSELDGSGLESSAMTGTFSIKGIPPENPTAPADSGMIIIIIIIIGAVAGVAVLGVVKRSQGRGRAEPVELHSTAKVVKMPEYVSEEELTLKQAKGQSGNPSESSVTQKPLQAEPIPLLLPIPGESQVEPRVTEGTSVLDRNNLITLMENAEAIHEYALAVQYATKLIADAEETHNKVDLAEYRLKQQKYLDLGLTAKREKSERDAIDAEKDRNYAKAAKLYELCKNLSNQLYKNGSPIEAERVKYFTAKSISIWKLVADTTTLAK